MSQTMAHIYFRRLLHENLFQEGSLPLARFKNKNFSRPFSPQDVLGKFYHLAIEWLIPRKTINIEIYFYFMIEIDE